jgi:hypothetical protein
VHPESERYLRTKRDRMGHLLPDDLGAVDRGAVDRGAVLAGDAS